jgi:hypothetical protein
MAFPRLHGPALDEQVYGPANWLGTIVATTTKNNHDTATPFNDTGDGLGGKLLLLQPDAACYVKFGTTNATTVTSSNGLKLAADQFYYVNVPSNYGWVAALAVSGTANVKVFELI